MSESTANSARGMPNVIATRSMANEPISARLRRTKRRPSAIERRIGGCSVSRRRGRQRRQRGGDAEHDHEADGVRGVGGADAERGDHQAAERRARRTAATW